LLFLYTIANIAAIPDVPQTGLNQAGANNLRLAFLFIMHIISQIFYAEKNISKQVIIVKNIKLWN
jgi:hypothetical protein